MMNKVAAAVFTTILAPIGVYIATQKIGQADSASAPAEKAAAPARPADPPADPSQVVAEGTAGGPEAALVEAHRNAVREVAGRMVPAAERNRADKAVDRVAADGDALVRRSEELGSVRERVLGRVVYWKKARVTVDRKAVADRLRAAGVRVEGVR